MRSELKTIVLAAFGSVVMQAFAQSPALAQVNGRPQQLAPHKPTRVAPASVAPITELSADAATALSQPYGGTPIDVVQYHYDTNRTGWNPTETDLTPASLKARKFAQIASLALDGNVFAQPLLVTGVTFPDASTHDVLLVVTGNNSVYAYDAHSYLRLWHVNLGKQQSTADVGCSDVIHGYGISATPVVVRNGSAASLYLTAATEPRRYEFHTQLHVLDVSTGADVRSPVEIAPSATLSDGSTLRFNAQNQWNRASIAYANGAIYLGIGSHCDNNPYAISGWVLKYGTDLSAQGAFHTVQTPHGYQLASIWMSGFAPAVDAAGNIWVVTGNGDFNPLGSDWGESVLKLSPQLAVLGSFSPSNVQGLNDGDTDFGSGGIMLLPHVPGQAGPDVGVAIGKSGVFYMINQAMPGGVGDSNAVQALPVGGGVWGGPAYYNGASGPTVFEQGDGGVLTAFGVSPDHPQLVSKATGTIRAGYGGSLPIVSSNGAVPGTAIVWLIRRSNPLTLEAYDAERLGAPIVSVSSAYWPNPSGNGFLTPMEANGRVYVPGYERVQVYGLTH